MAKGSGVFMTGGFNFDISINIEIIGFVNSIWRVATPRGTTMKIDIQQATKILAGLSNEVRLLIFRTLVARGGMPAGDLAEVLDVVPSTLSFHLKDMRKAGLVTSRKSGRQVVYAADFDNLNGLLNFLVDDCCGGRPELCIRTVKPASRCRSKTA